MKDTNCCINKDPGRSLSKERPEYKVKIVPWSPLYDLACKTDFEVFDDIMISMQYIKNLRTHNGESNKKLLSQKFKRKHIPLRKSSKMARLITNSFKTRSNRRKSRLPRYKMQTPIVIKVNDQAKEEIKLAIVREEDEKATISRGSLQIKSKTRQSVSSARKSNDLTSAKNGFGRLLDIDTESINNSK